MVITCTTPGYRSWQNMKARCLNPRHHNYRYYGGRGITVCDRWRDSFENFITDMGPRPSPHHSIDRRENAKNYEPGNCYWATRTEQNNNTRANRKLVVDGIGHTVAEWSRITGVPKACISLRINRLRWDAKAAITIPSNRGNRWRS